MEALNKLAISTLWACKSYQEISEKKPVFLKECLSLSFLLPDCQKYYDIHSENPNVYKTFISFNGNHAGMSVGLPSHKSIYQSTV